MINSNGEDEQSQNYLFWPCVLSEVVDFKMSQGSLFALEHCADEHYDFLKENK